MTPEERAEDIEKSMDALEDLDETGSSFGSKMVFWATHRAENYPQASENGKKGGIALKNVCRRIKLLFGERYGIHISSIVGIGTKVEVVLPISFKETKS